MDSLKEDAAAKRRAELERKKKKLQDLRNERELRRKEKEGNDETEVKEETSGLSEIDDMLTACGIDLLEEATETPPVIITSRSAEIVPTLKSTTSVSSVSSRKVELEFRNLDVFSLFPRETILYSKQTQTLEPEIRELLGVDVTPVESDEKVAIPEKSVVACDDVIEPEVDLSESEVTDVVIPELSKEDKEKVLNSENFCKFVEKNMRYVRRALSSDDIFVDYSGEEAELRLADQQEHPSLTLNCVFTNERLSRKRLVTSFDWSSLSPELLLTSYDKNETAHDPFGMCLIWNMKFKSGLPEYDFHCESPVMSAVFAKFQPNYLIGGTYSGQLVMWDMRAGKKTPVMRSQVATQAHTLPVYCMKVVGSMTSHSLVSISNDGKICTWSLDMLTTPYESSELQHKICSPICATCLTFPMDITENNNQFLVGSEDGSVYSAIRYDAKPSVVETFLGHEGPITGIDAHRANDGNEMTSQLFLTSSFDWSVKLWSTKEKKRLYTFRDSLTYVTDVIWSPIHPALFASSDGNGKLSLWNMNQEAELPVATIENENILNKIAWHSKGSMIAAGDDLGSVYLYEVGPELAHPKPNENDLLKSTLQDFQYKKFDDEALNATLRSVYADY